MSVATAGAGNVVIVDTGNHRLYQWQPESRDLKPVAGTGFPGFSGENGPATRAMLWGPQQAAIDRRGNILIVDTTNQRIRAIVQVSPSR